MTQFPMYRYFWLICGVWCGIVGAGYLRFLLRKKIEAGEFSREEVWSFTRRSALWIFLPCLALWLLQQSAGSDAALEYLKWPFPQRMAALALQAFVWAALLYWVFLKDGAKTLARYIQATSGRSRWSASPAAVKIGAIVVVAAGIGSFWINLV